MKRCRDPLLRMKKGMQRVGFYFLDYLKYNKCDHFVFLKVVYTFHVKIAPKCKLINKTVISESFGAFVDFYNRFY